MRAMNYSDEFLRTLLNDVKTVAVVGISANPVRPSYFVARYLGLKGYRVIPINPGLPGQELFGEVVYPDLASVPDEVNMVDIFRRSEAVPSIVEEALEKWPNLKAVWMQIGVESAEGRAMAEARGVRVVENRCPKIEYQRLFGELRMGGFNTGIISSKL
jgi:predicted CoA-binding protein